MTSGQKTALSLLISVILFAVFALAAFAGLFSAIDARFYEPAKIAGIRQRLDSVSQGFDEYLTALEDRFALGEGAFLKNSSVQTFVESRPSEQAALERSELLGQLRASTQGFLGLRVLDKNQNSLHYSTFKGDVLRRDQKNNLTVYKNYLDCLAPDGSQEIPAQEIACSDAGGDAAAAKRIFFDGQNRIVFSFPLYDKYSVFRGTALFYQSALDFYNFLLKRNLISVGQGLAFLSNAKSGADSVCGYALGLPSVGQGEFSQSLLDAWQSGSQEIQRLFAIDGAQGGGQNYWVAVTARSKSGVYASGIYNDEIFSLSKAARLLILACVFVTLFLICFLLLNLRRDDETVIRERIKTLQLGVVDEYLSKKEALDWETISGRRDAVTKEIIQSLGRRAKKRPEQVEALINRSWDELFAAMNLRPASSAGGLENAQEIKAMLQEILSSGAIKVQSVAAPASPAPVAAAVPKPAVSPAPAAQAAPVEDLEDVEEIEEVADAEPVEDLEEVADAEPVEDLEEVADAEPVEDLEEVADAEPVEDLEEVEDAEPVEDLEEVADAEPVEDLEEVADAEPVEDLEEVADAEPVEDLEEVAPLESVDETETAAPAAAQESDVHLHEFVKMKSASVHAPEEMFDITEDVGADFFAAGSKAKNPSLLSSAAKAQRDLSLDPYYKAREAFDPNEETEALVQHFEIGEPDYKSLDARNDDQTLNGTFEEDKQEQDKELSLEDFGLKADKEEFREDLEFAAPQNPERDDGIDVASTFTTETPRFERNPLAFAAAKKSQSATEPKAAQNAAAAIPLSNKEAFMFSSFGLGAAASLSELQAADCNAIVQDANGVFSIVGDLPTGGVVQDNSFKRLVDSVLNNA